MRYERGHRRRLLDGVGVRLHGDRTAMADLERKAMTEDKQTYGQYLDALRVKLATAEETHERNHRIYAKYKIETDAEIKDLRRKLERAESLIGALCDELEDEITNNYKSMYGNPVHPAMQHRLDRDLATTREARKFLRGEEECSEDRS